MTVLSQGNHHRSVHCPDLQIWILQVPGGGIERCQAILQAEAQ
jgi:hypothetical protein